MNTSDMVSQFGLSESWFPLLVGIAGFLSSVTWGQAGPDLLCSLTIHSQEWMARVLRFGGLLLWSCKFTRCVTVVPKENSSTWVQSSCSSCRGAGMMQLHHRRESGYSISNQSLYFECILNWLFSKEQRMRQCRWRYENILCQPPPSLGVFVCLVLRLTDSPDTLMASHSW